MEAEEPALVETGSTATGAAVREGLDALGVGPDDLAHIVVTHVHLDHAGGAGSLAPHFPRALVWVHERGVPHLADPGRLVASAARIYGQERLARMFGPVEPVPGDRLRSLEDGSRISLGSRTLEALYTPGHASHHVCLEDSETRAVFVGDALGVFLPDVQILRPATPPPEFHLELATASVLRVAERQPSRILFSHFGPADEVAHLCSLAVQRLERWTAVVDRAMRETEDLAAVTRILREGTAAELRPADERRRGAIADRYELLSSYEMNAMGIMRYVRKHRRAAQAPGG